MKKTTWDEFLNAEMLWFVNRLLHVFGWAIVFACDENDNIIEVYPARTQQLGFALDVDLDCRRAFLEHLDTNMGKLKTDVAELDAEDQANVAKVEALSVD